MNLRTNVYTAPPRLSASTRPGLPRRRRRELPHLDPPIHRTAQEVLEVERVVALRRLESVIHAFRVVVHQQVQDLTRLERLVRAHDHFESVLGRHRPHVQDHALLVVHRSFSPLSMTTVSDPVLLPQPQPPFLPSHAPQAYRKRGSLGARASVPP